MRLLSWTNAPEAPAGDRTLEARRGAGSEGFNRGERVLMVRNGGKKADNYSIRRSDATRPGYATLGDFLYLNELQWKIDSRGLKMNVQV